MRFKIDFKLLGNAPFFFPVNYQSEFSTWIHKMLHFQNPEFSKWLADKKYIEESTAEYRLYTFSDVEFQGHKVQDDRMVVEGDDATMTISFYAPLEIEPFIISIFENQEFKIGDSRGKVPIKIQNIELIGEPNFKADGLTAFSSLSPILIPDGNNHGTFMAPDHKDFEKAFFKSLMFKYANLVKFIPAGIGQELSGLNDLRFQLVGKPKPKIVKVKTDTPHQKAVKGFMFDFKMKA
ncbi:MAG: CRISPR-associated endoribonuclease Cas6, partial [Bacteroidota bacterium]